MSLGNGDVYFLENNTGDLWLYDQSAGSLTETNDDFNSSSNTDGAGCGIGLSGNDEWVPAFSVAQGSCSGSNKTVAVTLNNSGSDEAANYVVTYTIASSTSTLTSGTSVNGGASNTSLSVPAQANGTSVQLNWYAENSSYGLRSPSSGTTSVTISVDASSCSSDVTWSISTTVNTCWLGRANVSIAFAASGSGDTQYFDVEWSTDQSNWTSLVDGGALAAGDTDTYTTTAVNDGGTVYFHYRYGDSNPSSGSWLTTNVTNRTIDCDLMITVSTSLGSCSSGSATTTVSFVASDNGNTQYYDLQRRVDSGSWVTILDGESIAGGETNNHTATLGSGVYEWQYRIGDSNPSSGSYTSNGISGSTLTSRTVDCDVTFTISTSINSCSSGAATVSIAFAASAAGNTQYFDVQWSTDQSNWTSLVDGGGLTSGDTDTYTTSAVADGATVYFQYRYGDSNPSSGSFVNTNVTNRTIDCDYIDPSASQSLGSCSSGAATSTLTLSNSNSANTTAYFLVEYSLDGGSNWTQKAANQSVANNDSETLTQSVSHDSAITWRYKSSTSSGSFSGSYTTLSASSTVDCPVIDVSASQSLGSCSSGAATSTLTLSNSNSANTTAYFLVEYSLDGGSNWTQKAANQSVANNDSETLTQSVSHDSAITWRYKSSTSSGSFSGSYTTLSASSTVDCPIIDPSVSASRGSCSGGSRPSLLHMANSDSANATAYFFAEYSLDGGSSWSTLVANQSVAPNSSESASVDVPHGQQVRWRYKTSTTSNSFTGSYSTWGPSYVADCPTVDVSVSATLGTCSSGSATSSFAITNSASATTTAYVKVEYKIDSGSWVTKAANQSVGVDSTETLTQSVPVGSNITWRYEESTSSATFTGTPTATGSASSDVSCNITPSASQTLSSSCSGASKTSTLAISNSGSSQATAYFLIEYSVDGGLNWVQKEASKSVTVGGSDTVTQAVNNGTAIQWRYKTSTISGSFSGSYVTNSGLNSSTVSCVTPAVSTSAGSCSGGGAPISVLLDNTGQGATNYFKVQYSTDNSNWTDGIGGTHVAVSSDSTSTVSLSGASFANDVIVYIRYQTSSSTDFSSASTTTLSSIEIDCPILNASATAAAGSCSSGSAAIPVTLINTNSTAAGTFTVSYSTDGGSNYTTLSTATVGAGQTDTSSLSIPSQTHTTQVIIKYSVANTSEGLSQSEATLSTITINCPVTNIAVTSATNGCGNNGVGQAGVYGGTKISIDNSASNVAVTLYVQKRKVNPVNGNETPFAYFANLTTGGESGESISAGAETNYTFDSHPNGMETQYRYSTDGSSWTNLDTIVSSCAGVTTSLGSCSASQTQTPSITLFSGADSTVSVFFRVEYSTDSGSSWTQLNDDEEVTTNSSETFSAPALANGETIQWRYSTRKSAGAHDSSSWVTDETDIPGVDPTLSYQAICVSESPTTTTLQLQPQLQQLQLQQLQLHCHQQQLLL